MCIVRAAAAASRCAHNSRTIKSSSHSHTHCKSPTSLTSRIKNVPWFSLFRFWQRVFGQCKPTIGPFQTGTSILVFLSATWRWRRLLNL
ncbi:uncharacterized protein Dmoj_GI26864, isoform H [Drosophila mojavensis]|uniref:Uncharacterized protein, isoform H n=1 Tax=Drosophila mojavensis TaxID=7230 RepID=A0A0Q9WXN1_DROMO|nr:uncharacterized protein Dmoj_GI26864, isoform H [Drosophila mojavensis]